MAENGDGDDKPYTVGRGKPPVHTRWKKGVSGNPTGRSKKPPTLQDDLMEEGSRLIPLPDGSGQITVRRAMVHSLFSRSIKRDNKAAQLLLALHAREPQEEAADEGGALTEEEEAIFKDFLARQAKRRGK